MNAGVVVYREHAMNGMIGQWTHQKTDGAIGREVVEGVTFANVQGAWPVSIYGPGSEVTIFTGTLQITELGSALQLRWDGSSTSTGKQQTFEGIGILLPEDKLLSATFEEITE